MNLDDDHTVSTGEDPPLDPAELLGDATLDRLGSPTIEYAEVEGQVVVWDSRHESLHLLDPASSLMFQLADGTIKVSETIDLMCEEGLGDARDVRSWAAPAAMRLRSLGLVWVVGSSQSANDEGPAD